MPQSARIAGTLFLVLAAACGEASKAGPSMDRVQEEDALGSIVFPDSRCSDGRCVANTESPGTCDPNGANPALADCDAWRINGTFSLAAIRIDPAASRGLPPPPHRSEGDADDCPPNAATPKGTSGPHCCQRVAKQGPRPAFVLTGVRLNDPPTFRGGAISSANKEAIEEDRYNWILELSSGQPGDLTIKSGLGLQNKDGSYAFAEGPFELGGATWNQRGEWDPHEVPGRLSADGVLSYAHQYVPSGRFFQLPLWGAKYAFAMMALSLTGIEMTVKLDAPKVCAGYLTGFKEFDQVGTLRAYLPLEPLRAQRLHFAADDSGASLCQITAQLSAAGDCQKPLSQWGR